MRMLGCHREPSQGSTGVPSPRPLGLRQAWAGVAPCVHQAPAAVSSVTTAAASSTIRPPPTAPPQMCRRGGNKYCAVLISRCWHCPYMGVLVL